MNLLAEILLISLFCNGLFEASAEGMIFHRPADWVANHFPLWLSKPIIECPYCMASVWGLVVHILFIYSQTGGLILNLQFLSSLILVCIPAVFLNGLIHHLIELIKFSAKQYGRIERKDRETMA